MDILTNNIYTSEVEGDVFLHRLFEEQAAKTPDVIAVQFGGAKITYAELNKKADALAQAIINQAPGSLVVGVSTLRAVETIAAMLGILKAGKAYLPIDPSYPVDRLEQIIEDSGVNTVLAIEEQKPLFKHLPVAVIESDKEHAASALARESVRTNVAYIIYTSGSTGKPKGVCVGHIGVVNLVYYHKRISPYLGVGSKTLQFSPLVFDASVVEVFCTFGIGGTLVLVDDETRIDPVKLIRYVDEMQVNRINVPFVALQYFTEIADAEKFYPQSLLEVITAGEQLKVTPQIVRFFQALPNCVFYNMYGPTETSVASTALKLEGPPESWPLLPTIGKAIDNTENFVLDEQLNLLPDGEVGELCISGINVTYGYLNRPELTAEKFVNWLHNGKITRIYRSGDLCRFLPDGNTEYMGRKDTQVKIRGNRVEIGEIEVLINQLDGIQQAVVIAREDTPGDKRLVAYLVASHSRINTAQVRDVIEDKLPEFMMPSAFVWMTGLPKTTSGKVDRNNLPKPDLKRPELATLYKPASSTTQKHIVGIWMYLLQLEKIGINDNFFELGGNSLLGLKTVASLKKYYNLELPITKLYQFPTIAGIAAFLDGTEGKGPESILPAKLKVKTGNGDIAVIGMVGRFPGANNVEELWKVLVEGRETISFFTDVELAPSIPPDVRYAPNYVKARGIVDGSDEFDPGFFGLSPRVAELMDPQQRIFLELAWEALESVGHLPSHYHGSVGVFAGCGNNTYYINNVIPNRHLIDKIGSFLTTTLNEKDYVATRVAYELDLKGPAVSVHSACSTSLLAIAQAVDSIRNGQCNVALAGGVSISSPIKSGHLYQEGIMLSADGHCRSFDAQADGTVFSDGAGVVLLKGLEEAEADGDIIYSVIKGVGLNNDGNEKGSFTAPNSTGQAGAIAMAIQNAGVSPADISYVEAHGTATVLGDPIEIEGLTLAFGPQESNQYCAIGSVKSNMGHLVAAAGVAGFIKTTLALYNRQIPASLHHTKPNPNIDFANSPFYVNTKLTSWDTDKKRIAGVSSFGVGGTNVHVILEEYPRAEKISGEGKSLQLIQWSAKAEESANLYRNKLAAWVKDNPKASLADVAYTLQTTRTGFAYRNFLVAASREELLEKLAADAPKANTKKLNAKATEVAFMFPGQGSQFVNMGRHIYEQEPIYRAAVDECVALLRGTAQENILSVMYSDGDEAEATEILKNTLYTQPALFITSYAMARLWMSWGIVPGILTGHSIGEFVAAHLAGVFSLPDAVKLIATRAKLVSEAEGGDMLSVRMPESEILAILPDTLSISVLNTKNATVVGGPSAEVAKFSALLAQRNIAVRVLQTSHAFHSGMMDEVVAPFEEVVKTVKLRPPTRAIISTITGKWLSEAEALDPHYWAAHVRRTVRFADVANLLAEDETRIMLEVGPGNVLSTLVRQQAAPKQITAIAGIDSAEGDMPLRSALQSLGQLWLNGIDPDWSTFYLGQSRLRLNLPTYAFSRKRLWAPPVVPISPLTPPFEAPTEILIENSTETPLNMPVRKDLLIAKLKDIFEDTSGIEVDSSDASFIEIGFDSLLLTQIATSLKKEFKIPITFRKLFEEFNSLDLLAGHLDSVLPADKFQPAQAAPAARPAAQPVYQQPTYQQPVFQPQVQADGGTQALNMIAQQLQLLASQVATMQGSAPAYAPMPVQQPVYNHQQHSPQVAAYANAAHPPVAPPAMELEPQPEITAEEMAELKKPFGATARIERQVQGLTAKQQALIDKLTKDYNEKTKTSKAQTQEHRPYMADPRVVSGFRPLTKEMVYPIIINRSKGSRLWDVDGNEYIDALNGFGSNMLGYQPDVLTKAIHEQVDKGYEIGPQHELAGDVCKLLCEFTQFDRAGLCNTGSEAVLGAMRIARTVTGRSLIVAFAGSYHGIMDEVIVRSTKKLKTVPAASGILPENVQSMLILDYGTDATLKIIKERADEIAAVLVEPVQSRRPEFKPVEFLKELRVLTAEKEIALVFDEVISGFRMHQGGAQAIFGVKADIGTYGKVIGGGMPVGAICGVKKYMDALDGGQWQFGDLSVPEVGVTYFAGTFVRHPLALAAAKASLLYMKERGPALQEKLTRLTTRFADGMRAKCEKAGVPITIVGFGSLWRMKFLEDIPYSELLFTLMRLKGVHILDGFPCFITDAHTEQDIDTMLAAFTESLDEMIEAGFFAHRQETATEPVTAAVAPPAEQAPVNVNTPPVPGAKLGRGKDGKPGWFIPDQDNPGKYLQIK